jgi:hypothetical protein
MANRFLNNITINDAYTLPSTDGTLGQAIVTDGAGNLTFSTVAAGTADAALKISFTIKNVSGGTLSAGTIVRAAPTTNPPAGNVLEVDVADNSAASTMPAIGILTDSVADAAEGDAIAFGRASGFSTSGYTEGDPIWVGSSGAFVGTKPTGSDLIQRFGQIVKVHSTNGSIEVFGAGRTNDVPNLSQGKIWVGTATNTAESTLIDVDETNNILTVNGKVYYGNVFSQESDLPSATTYHGMFAHVHGTGYAYYAHAGSWVKLAKLTDINDSTLTVTAGTGLSGGGTFTTNQSSDSAVTVNLDDTAVTPGTYGDANNTPQITIDQQGRITSATTVTTAGSGSGGGGAELSIERNVFTATANQTAFTISSDITASSNTQVYIDGVYQAKSNYTTSGSVVTFSTGVPLGSEVEVVHFIAVYSKIYTDTFTGNGSTTQYTTSKDVSDENETQVYIDGVYQSKDNYTTSGTTVTFSTAPPNGTAIEVVHFDAAEYTSLASNQFTGTGSQTAFTLTQSDVDEDSSFVFIQGVYQEKSTYSISGSTLTFTTAPLSGYTIEVITAGVVANVTSSPVTSVNGQTGAVTIETPPVTSVNGQTGVVTVETGTDWDTSIKTANFTAVAGKGYFVNTTSAEITVTMPSSPSAGDEVHLVDYAGTADTNKIIITSSNKINSSNNNVKIDYERGGVSLVYSDSTQGWLAYNAANETATSLVNDPILLNVDYLVVAGGGSGGISGGGGGGAGGLRTSYSNSSSLSGHTESSLSVPANTDITVTVGAGGASKSGAGSGQAGNTGDDGGDSIFSTITSTGGGGGRARPAGSPYTTLVGRDGGSGGGAASPYSKGSSAVQGGSAVTSPVVQGYDGGDGNWFASGYQAMSGGGGGGAGQAGADGANQAQGADGGDGLAVSITGSSVTYAGGGAGDGANGPPGGAGGAGGGGAGGYGPNYTTNFNFISGTSGTVNTGGGGGGASDGSSGAGGSGIVIVRYPNTYTITETTSPAVLTFSTATDGSDKVTTFTAGTSGTIQFS